MPKLAAQVFTRSRPQRALAQRRFSILFFFLLAYLVLYPYAIQSRSSYVGFRVFGAVVTVLSVYAVSFRRGAILIAVLLAAPALLQRIILPGVHAGAIAVSSIVLTFAFDIFIVAVIFRRVFSNKGPTREAVFGALCIYLLVGFSFASLYSILATVEPHAFYLSPLLNAHSVPDRFDLIYYSCGTITCLGASGITPVSDQARSISIIEALLGILYLAVLISRLLSAYNSREPEKISD